MDPSKSYEHEVSTAGGSASAPSRDSESEPEALEGARQKLRSCLAEIHVFDILPERSRVLAVDATLPIHAIVSAVLEHQHPKCAYRGAPATPTGLPGDPEAMRRGPHTPIRAGETEDPTRGRAPRCGTVGESAPAPLQCGIVAPSLPNNVLAEVCEFQGPNWPPKEEGKTEPIPEDKDQVQSSTGQRRWTSPDDGWGRSISICSISMQDLEKMPMGTPVTVGEVCQFLAHACQCEPPSGDAAGQSGSDERWAEPAQGNSEDSSNSKSPPVDNEADPLDWSLARWRRELESGADGVQDKVNSDKVDTPQKDGSKSASSAEPPSPLFVEERPCEGGPVLVHRVANAPPRPMLSTDDPEASLLKAVELLLAYPELDALPVVNPFRCTVVSHVTLAACLAFTLQRLRGADFQLIGDLRVGDSDDGEDSTLPQARVYDVESADAGSWASRRMPSRQEHFWVLTKSQPMKDLLAFFARTHHSAVPIVEAKSSTDQSFRVIGLVGRRDLLHFLDLAAQSAKLDPSGEGDAEEEEIRFDIEEPLGQVLQTLRKFKCLEDRRALQGGEEPPVVVGAALSYEKALPLKLLMPRVLAAENRKVLFVEESSDEAPRLLRVVSVGDVWRAMLGERSSQGDVILSGGGGYPGGGRADAAREDADDLEVINAH